MYARVTPYLRHKSNRKWDSAKGIAEIHLFNAITSTKNAEAANYPFCTIEPNSGIVAVPDKRLDKLAEVWQTNKKTPAIVEFVDIAGLVKGASQGAGLGNKFLGHIRECDAIVHVVRCFDDDNIIHVVEDVTKAEAVDPISDIDAIDYELILSDLEVVQNRAGRMAKAAKSGNNKGAAAEAAWLQQLADHLSAGKPARSFDFDESDAEQQTVLHEMGLLSAKPVLYACNVGEDDLMEGIENNKYVPLVAARAKEEGARYIPICAKTEEDIADYSPEEKKKSSWPRWALGQRPGQPHHRQLRPAGPDLVPDRRQERVPRLDHPQRHQGPAGCRQDPQ